MQDDRTNIISVLNGNKAAFRYIIQDHQQMVMSIALSIVKNKNDADEVVQNTFVRTYTALRSFKAESKFSSWIYRIATNEALKLLRKKRKSRSYQEINKDTSEHLSIDAEVMDDLNKEEIQRKLENVLKKMKPKEALVLKLHYLHELSIVEVSKSTGFSESNVKVLLHRARKSFAILYKD